MERFFLSVALAAAALAGASVRADAGPPEYRAVLLPETEMYRHNLTGLNDAGAAVGFEWTGMESSIGVMWRQRSVEELEPPPEPLLPMVRLLGMNNAGTVVGATVSWDDWRQQQFPVIWRDGRAAYLETWNPALNEGMALDINNSGTIVGYTVQEWLPGSDWYPHRPTVWTPDLVAHRLSLPTDWTKRYAADWSAEAQFINDAGTIAGVVDRFVKTPVIWTPEGESAWLPMPEGYELIGLRALTKHNQVLGQLRTPAGGYMGVVWEGGVMTVLRWEPGWGGHVSMNDHGMIVTGTNGPSPGARLYDGSRWHLVEDLIVDWGREFFIHPTPVYINNEGVILGVAWVVGDNRFAWLMLVPIR